MRAKPGYIWNQGPLVLDEMYLDTTFLSRDYSTFPSRKKAVEEVWRLCSEWIGQNKVLRSGARKGELNDKFVVVLHTSARWGNISGLTHKRGKYFICNPGMAMRVCSVRSGGDLASSGQFTSQTGRITTIVARKCSENGKIFFIA